MATKIKETKLPETPTEKKEKRIANRNSFRALLNERLDDEERLKILDVLIAQVYDDTLRASDRRSAIELLLDILGEFSTPLESNEPQKIVLKIE